MYMIIIDPVITVNPHVSPLSSSPLRNKNIHIHIGEITNPPTIDITKILFHGISKYTFFPESFILEIFPKNIINIRIDIIICPVKRKKKHALSPSLRISFLHYIIHIQKRDYLVITSHIYLLNNTYFQ